MNRIIEKALGLQMNGFSQEALNIYQKAYKKEPTNLKICEYYGAALLETGHYNQARKLLKKVLDEKIEKPQVLNNLATVNRFLKRYNEALINVKSAIKFRPDYQDAWVNCGNIQNDIGNYQEAIKSYKKAVKLNPQDKEVYLVLAQTYLLNHEFDLSLDIYKKQKKLFHDVRFLIGELICYRAIKDYNKALSFADQLRQSFDNELMWFEWVQTLWMAKESKKAEEQAQIALKKFDHFPALDDMIKLMDDAKVS